jgi:hypothetical protein
VKFLIYLKKWNKIKEKKRFWFAQSYGVTSNSYKIAIYDETRTDPIFEGRL